MSFANITISGHLGKDAEQVTMTNTGNLLTKFSIAVNAGYGDKEVTNWYDCVIFGERGTKLLQYLTKGKEVIVNGELKATKREHEGKGRQDAERGDAEGDHDAVHMHVQKQGVR